MSSRRQFITLLGGAAAWPLAARAQQPAMPVIGILAVAAPEANAIRLRAFREGLRTVGYVEGQNVKIEYRWAEAHTGRLPELAAGLVRDRVAVLVAAGGTASAVAAKAATREIPIVFGTGADPVEVGLVASLNRPGGNLTGVTTLNVELGPKRLELLHELVPAATVMAVLINPTNPNADAQSRGLQAAARTLGVQFHGLPANDEGDFDTVFATLAKLRVGALLIAPDAFFISRSEQLAELTVRPELCTNPSILHGGAVMAFADTLGAAGTIVNLPEGTSTTTIESKTNFVAALRAGETARAECSQVHIGRTTMVWQTRIFASVRKE